MNNMMLSVVKYLRDNYSTLGLFSADDVRDIQRSKKPFLPGSRLIIATPLRTTGDSSRGVPFGNLLRAGVKGEQLLTQLEVECFTRAKNSDTDFPWYAARALRDRLYDLLVGPSRGGVAISRLDFSGPSPAQVGEIWFEVDGRSSPVEDEIEDPNDSANKSVFLTYNVHWWRPI